MENIAMHHTYVYSSTREGELNGTYLIGEDRAHTEVLPLRGDVQASGVREGRDIVGEGGGRSVVNPRPAFFSPGGRRGSPPRPARGEVWGEIGCVCLMSRVAHFYQVVYDQILDPNW